jgi:hypothetical protein
MDRSIDGTGYARAFFAATENRFLLRHVLTNAQWATLVAFYDANRTTPFDLTWTGQGGVSYTGLLFEAMPQKTELGAGLLMVEVRMASR